MNAIEITHHFIRSIIPVYLFIIKQQFPIMFDLGSVIAETHIHAAMFCHTFPFKRFYEFHL